MDNEKTADLEKRVDELYKDFLNLKNGIWEGLEIENESERWAAIKKAVRPFQMTEAFQKGLDEKYGKSESAK